MPPWLHDRVANAILWSASHGLFGLRTIHFLFSALRLQGNNAADTSFLLWQATSHFLPYKHVKTGYRYIRQRPQARNRLTGDDLGPPHDPLLLFTWQLSGHALEYRHVDPCLIRLENVFHINPTLAAHTRLLAARLYERPSDDVGTVLSRFLDHEPALPWAAQTITATCAQHPALRAAFLPDLITRLQAAIERGDAPSELLNEALHDACRQLNMPGA